MDKDDGQLYMGQQQSELNIWILWFVSFLKLNDSGING